MHFELLWAIISIILVISPEEKDSKKLSIDRFRSNFIGSVIALICVLINGNSVYMIIVGIILTIITCRIFHIMNMARVAIVALLIIMIQPHQEALTYAAILRFVSVGAGCLIGLTIVVTSSYVIKQLKIRYGIPKE